MVELTWKGKGEKNNGGSIGSHPTQVVDTPGPDVRRRLPSWTPAVKNEPEVNIEHPPKKTDAEIKAARAAVYHGFLDQYPIVDFLGKQPFMKDHTTKSQLFHTAKLPLSFQIDDKTVCHDFFGRMLACHALMKANVQVFPGVVDRQRGDCGPAPHPVRFRTRRIDSRALHLNKVRSSSWAHDESANTVVQRPHPPLIPYKTQFPTHPKNDDFTKMRASIYCGRSRGRSRKNQTRTPNTRDLVALFDTTGCSKSMTTYNMNLLAQILSISANTIVQRPQPPMHTNNNSPPFRR